MHRLGRTTPAETYGTKAPRTGAHIQAGGSVAGAFLMTAIGVLVRKL